MLNLHCREVSGVPFSPARCLIGKVPQDKPWSLTRAKRNREGGNACRDCVQAQHRSLLLRLRRKKKKMTANCHHMPETQHSLRQPIPRPSSLCSGIKMRGAEAALNPSQVPGAVQAQIQAGCVSQHNGALFATCIL